MDRVLIILTALDIEPARLAAERLGQYRTVTFDPTLYDELLASGLANVAFVDFPGCPTFPDLHNGSRERALAAERTLLGAIRHYLPGVGNFSWLHLNWYYLFIASHWYGALASHVAPELAQSRPVIFINDNPSLFFWPSFVPAVALLEAFGAAGIAFDAFNYGERADETGIVPNLIDHGATVGQSWDVLVHLPTCLHDQAFLAAELEASRRSVLAFTAKYWDVQMPAHTTLGFLRTEEVIGRLPATFTQQLDDISALLRDRIDPLLAPCLRSPGYRERQVEQLVRLYRSQIVAYHLLQDFLDGRPPRRMLLADHDANFHGPLLAYAETRRIPVLLVPHSKTTADIQFSRGSVHCLVHPIQGDHIDDALGLRVPSTRLAFPERLCATLAPSGPLRRVGLLLNATTLNGVYVTSHDAYMEGIGRIVQWCRGRGVELLVRSRPGYTTFALLAGVTGIPAATLREAMSQSLAQFAASLDVCLMYDAPTTAEIEFLKNGIPILNPIPEPLAKYEAVISDPAVVPRGAIEDILFRLDGFVADEANLHAFRQAQFGRYAAAFADARLLRSLL